MESPEAEGLSKEEDDSLRRLSYFADVAGSTEWTDSRIAELRNHDRRRGIRPPRDEPLPILDPDDRDEPEDA
jgi:hypothetical protein